MESVSDFIPKGPEENEFLPAQTFVVKPPIPESASTARAAILALSSGSPNEALDTYSQVLSETNSKYRPTTDALKENIEQAARGEILDKGLVGFLSDPDVPLEQKKAAIAGVKNMEVDPIEEFNNRSVIASSDGESIDGEQARESIIPSLAASFRESYSVEQAAVNNFKAGLQKDTTTAGTIGEVAQSIVPGATSVYSYRLLTNLNEKLGKSTSFGKKLKAVIFPGSTLNDIRDRYDALGPQERLEFVKALTDTVRETRGIIFSSESQMMALDTLDKVLDNYSPAEATFDNIWPLLDAFGIGQTIRAFTKGSRVAKETTKIVEAGEETATSAVPFKAPEDIKMPTPHPDKKKLPALYEAREKALSETSGRANNGDVASLNKEKKGIEESIRQIDSGFKEQTKNLQRTRGLSRKEAESVVRKGLGDQRTDLENRLASINTRLERNAQSAKAEQRLSALDTEIDRIEHLPDVDGVVRVNPIVDAFNRAAKNSVVAVENPATAGSLMMRTNPALARNLLATAVADESGKAAQALFGMTRTEVLANAVVPKHLTVSGAIPAKPVNVASEAEKVLDPLSKSIQETLDKASTVSFTEGEVGRATDVIKNDFANPTGLKVFDGMDGFHFDAKDGKISISSVYGTKGGSFSSAEDAIASTNISLKNYGDMTPNIELLKKDGMNYVPTTLAAEKGKTGDYLVRLKFDKNVSLEDVKRAGPLDEFKVGRNWFDRVGSLFSEKHGSFTRHFLASADLLDKRLTTAAAVSDTLSNKLEKTLQSYLRDTVRQIKALPKGEQDSLVAYFIEANEKGISLSLSDFARRGFTEEQFAAASKWRHYWDTIYSLQNADMRKTLSNQGFMLLDNGKDRLFAKPIPKNLNNAANAYDPSTGKVLNLSRQEMDDLYAKGGTLAEARTSFNVDGRQVENLIIRNDKDGYLRAFSDGDNVLNYREGYYTTSYRAPIFIDKIDPKTGKAIAVATAKDRTEAAQFVKRASKENPDVKYSVRDSKERTNQFKEDVWHLNEQAGRSSQKRRGQPLIEADGSNRLEGSAYFDSPFEAAIRASTSISGRTIYREVISTAKERFIQQFGDTLTPDPITHTLRFPSSSAEISSTTNIASKHIADARSSFEFIHYLENGYTNGLDNLFKSTLNAIGNGLGESAISHTGFVGGAMRLGERAALRAAQTNVSGLSKFFVFNMYLATSIFRQWIVQPAQIARLVAYDPRGFASLPKYLFDYSTSLRLGTERLSKNSKDFVKFVDSTGVLDGVDKRNLVRGTLTAAGEQHSLWEKSLGKVFNPLRVLGYDLGEKTNQLGHMASVFERYRRMGADVTSKRVQQEMLSKVAAISYDMRFSGDMPYNQNSLSAFVQFLQVPHKAVLQAFDRRLSAAERTRLVLGDVVLYGGIGGLGVYSVAKSLFGEDVLDETPLLKKYVVDGALQTFINSTLNEALETANMPTTEFDINGSLSPYDFAGYKKMFFSLFHDGGLLDAFTNTPIGNLAFKDGNRVQEAVATVGRWIGFKPDSEISPTDVWEVANSLASITSGWSNLHKAALIWNTGKIMNKQGQVLMDNASPVVALAQVFGVSPKEVSDYYENSLSINVDRKHYELEVANAVRTAIKVAVGKTQLGTGDPKVTEIVNALLLSKYKNDPVALAIINRELGFAAEDPKIGLVNSAISASRLPDDVIDREQLKEVISADNKEVWENLDKWESDVRKAIEQQQ